MPSTRSRIERAALLLCAAVLVGLAYTSNAALRVNDGRSRSAQANDSRDLPAFRGFYSELVHEHAPPDANAAVVILVHGQHSQDLSNLNEAWWDQIVARAVPGDWTYRNKERWMPLLDAMKADGVYYDLDVWRYVHDNRDNSSVLLGWRLGEMITAGMGIPDPDSLPAGPAGFRLNGRPLIIVAHSLGGIVARQFMSRYRFPDALGPGLDGHADGNLKGKLGGEAVTRLITLATPHLGSPGADVLLLAAKNVSIAPVPYVVLPSNNDEWLELPEVVRRARRLQHLLYPDVLNDQGVTDLRWDSETAGTMPLVLDSGWAPFTDMPPLTAVNNDQRPQFKDKMRAYYGGIPAGSGIDIEQAFLNLYRGWDRSWAERKELFL